MSKSYSSLKNNINVHYYDKFFDKKVADNYFDILEKNVVYNSDEESQVTVHGKKHVIPRKQVAYGDLGTSYKFAGVTVLSKSWSGDDILSKTLLEIKNSVEICTRQKFNFVLINRYKDGESYIGAHRDDEKELGDDPTIAGVSFGAERDVVFAPYRFIPIPDPKGCLTANTLPLVKDKLRVNLGHGSLFVMLDKTNTYWTHSIPKSAKVNGPRVSLTFRYINL